MQLFAAVISRVLLELLEFPERMVHRESADHRVLQDQLDQLDQG